ncbi:MAG TPA: lysophospholipid acyltransferase family protein [Pyrinomonadaceae bacterium]|nr:lysophospholipid acyltransferase family protein [Pyrinomonadaceae bacterium]
MAKPGKLQTLLEYAAAKSVLTGLGMLPGPAAIAVGKSMGRVFYLLAGELKRTAGINLRLAFPEKTEAERSELVRECFDNLGRELGLFSQFATRSQQELIDMIEPSGFEHLDAAIEKYGQRIILWTAHLGAWELTSFGFSFLGHPFTFLVRRIDNPRIEDMVDRVRTRFGNKTLDKLSAARSMLKILRQGETPLGLLFDLNTLDDEAIFVDFFGVPAATSFIVSKLAVRTKAPLLPVFAPWNEATKKFQLIVTPLVEPEITGDEEADVRCLTTRLSRIIEDQIRQHPGQWLWVHKRWKTRPPGEPPIY